eukprot:357000-Chlamydomonas_euryale.AAC.7
MTSFFLAECSWSNGWSGRLATSVSGELNMASVSARTTHPGRSVAAVVDGMPSQGFSCRSGWRALIQTGAAKQCARLCREFGGGAIRSCGSRAKER